MRYIEACKCSNYMFVLFKMSGVKNKYPLVRDKGLYYVYIIEYMIQQDHLEIDGIAATALIDEFINE